MLGTFGWRRMWVAAPVVLVGAWAGEARVVGGECSTVFGADVCVWGKTSRGEVVEFGLVLPLAAVERAPADAEMPWPPVPTALIPLPTEVKASTGFDHLWMGWEAMGHPPTVFEVPHFDFHFYTIPPEQVRAIDCTNPLKPARLPNGYALNDMIGTPVGDLIGLCVPEMGMHAVPTEIVESRQSFEKAILVGYYNQRLIFVEPMITKSLLMKRKSFSLEMPELVDAQARVRYPTRFRAEYDANQEAYRFVFSKLKSKRPVA